MSPQRGTCELVSQIPCCELDKSRNKRKERRNEQSMDARGTGCHERRSDRDDGPVATPGSHPSWRQRRGGSRGRRRD